jgi:hypothetical protein
MFSTFTRIDRNDSKLGTVPGKLEINRAVTARKHPAISAG